MFATSINRSVAIAAFFHFVLYHAAGSVDQDYNTGRIPEYVRRRQDTVPVIYVNGSHYDVGYMVGKTFGSVIQDFVGSSKPLQRYLDVYETSDRAREIYDECLETTENYFPQYLVELKGMADGAGVPFHELFLMHLNDVLMSNVKNAYGSSARRSSTGCSTLIVNIPSRGQFIGRNEDAEKLAINRFYIVSAHIHPSSSERGGVFEAREEKWEAMTYAGSLPGHASGHNYHGLVFTINSIYSEKPFDNKIPRAFLTRALLATKSDVNDIQETLTNRGAGTADAFHVTAGFVEDSRYGRAFYSIDVTPSLAEPLSNVTVQTLKSGSTSFYTNRLQYSESDESRKSDWKCSNARQKLFVESTMRKPVESLDDLLKILGATEDGDWQIFRDSSDDPVNTINLGVFDFIERTWSIWTNNPRTNPAVIKLPLKFTTFVSPAKEDRATEKRPYYAKILSDVSGMYVLGKKTLTELIN